MTTHPEILAAKAFRVDCVETEQEFLQLEKDWNRLLFESDRPVPFLTWEWVSTWWRHFGRNSRLFVLVARDETDRIVGIAPLHIVQRTSFAVVPVRCVEFLGYKGSAVCVDHLDFLTRQTDRVEVTRHIVGELERRRDQWDSLSLGDLAEDSLIPGLIGTLRGYHTHKLKGETCPYVPLPEHWNDLLASLKSKHRTELKRRREKLNQEYKVSFDVCADPARAGADIEELARLHSSSWNHRGESGNFSIQAYREFHVDVAERMARGGYLYLANLSCNETLVACLYGFHCGGRFFGYQTGFDSEWISRSVGAVLQAYVLEDVIERLRAIEYDFLRGTEEYKYRWTSQERSTSSFFCWSRSFGGRAARAEVTSRRELATIHRQIKGHFGKVRSRLST